MLETDDLADKIAVDNKWVQESNSDALGDYIKQAIKAGAVAISISISIFEN